MKKKGGLKFYFLGLIPAFFSGISCGPFVNNELVMCEGMTIAVTNKNGKLTIEALDKHERKYSWDDKCVTLNLMSRWHRWNGSLGIYSPTGTKDIHCVVEEGQLHFCSKEEVLEWIACYHFNGDSNFVYSSSGLGIGWVIRKDQNSGFIALLADVWQFYISGKKPTGLPGGNDSAIKVVWKENSQVCNPPVGKFMPSQPAVINGREYSGQAIDLMKEQKISSKDIERIIRQPGWKYKHGLYYTCGLKGSKLNGSTIWVTIDENGRIILVGS